MKTITLNKCLSKLDMIMFKNVVDFDIILEILNDVRKYVINSNREYIGESNRGKTVMMVLQFINYLIQTTLSSPMTNQFINHCSGLRSLILKLESGSILIIDGDEEIYFDRCCNSFLNKYVVKDEDEDKTKEQKLFEAVFKVCKTNKSKST